MDKHFAGVPPLLMQHTLRDFVNSDPSRRRTYFERLLRLDELTELIRLSVISDERLSDFPGPHGTVFLSMWNELGSGLRTEEAKQAYHRVLPNAEPVTSERMAGALATVAKSEFPAIAENLEDTGQIIDVLRTEQAIGRQNAFPLLGRLRPKRPVADDAQHIASADAREIFYKAVREAWAEYEPARLAMQELGESNLAISQAFKILSDAGMIRHGTDAQACPLCAYTTAETLLHDRVAIVQSWEPIRSNEQNTRHRLEGALSSVVKLVSEAVTFYHDVLPDSPSETEWETALSGVGARIRDAVDDLKQVINGQKELSLVAWNAKRLAGENIPAVTSAEECETFIERCDNLLEGLVITPIAAKSYVEALTAVETAIGVEASLDPDYRLRERFILCDEKTLEISESLKWERAGKSAQRDLEKVREGLMSYRQQFLEARRQSFNTHIERIWNDLRKDRYSSFSHINIPRPSGRGFPVAIELKANLDDSETRQQVDVLKVFSESQVNALGVAAFVTRSKLLGHRMLVLDDPVQSMDEDHFKSFARDLLSDVLEDGFQIILLTHNGTFARDVSHYHYDRPDYVTMSIQHSRRKGSGLTEGNRRVAERLKLAEHMVDDGNRAEAWRLIRLAVERLYTVLRIKYGSSAFNPESWQHQTAEYMWDQGVGTIVSNRLPDSADRFKEILDMTAGGAHDTEPQGETELRNSIAFLRSARNDLKVGG